MFFDGRKQIKHWYNYLKNPRIKVFSKLLKNIVDIKKIENNIVYSHSQPLTIADYAPVS